MDTGKTNYKSGIHSLSQSSVQLNSSITSDSTILQRVQSPQMKNLALTPFIQNNPSENKYLDLNDIVLNVPTYTDDAFKGYNIFMLEDETFSIPPRGLIVTNMEGELINEQLPITFPPDAWGFHIEFINSTHLLYSKEGGAHLWDMYKNTAYRLGGIYGHHEHEYNPLNNTFFTLVAYRVKIEGKRYEFDVIAEYDTKGQLVWELDVRTFTSHTQWCPFKDTLSDSEGYFRDLLHSNTVFFDSEEDIIYYNARNLNTFYKIDHKTGKVLWGLGEYGNFTLFDQKGKQKHSLFYHAHSVEKVDENTFILFDNDLHNQTNPYNEKSRILEITINETTMNANESWSWIAPPEYYSVGYGDADRLPNGNRLGVFGWGWHLVNGTNSIGARLVEVSADGDIVWELNIPNDEGKTVYSVYRMERFHLSPILNSPPDINALATDNLTVSWQTWYNFRAKRRMQGTYTFFLNGTVIKNGIHVFDKFWRPSNCTINLGKLGGGTYNLTLVLTDEGGHPTTDSITIAIVEFYLEREGPLSIEHGQDDALIKWRGDTTDPLSAIMTVNNENLTSFVWDGEDIILDLNRFDSGVYSITIQLFYGIRLLYSQRFVVNIYRASAPTISKSPVDQVIIWNESNPLIWEFFDQSPASWQILVNNTSVEAGNWESQLYQLTWQPSTLDEGSYNITLLVIDALNHRMTKTTWLTVVPPNPPLVMAASNQTEIQWGVIPTVLHWEVHGAVHYQLWRNSTLIYEGDIGNTEIEVQIENWKGENWNPGIYNLTMQVSNVNNVTTIHTTWIQVWVDVGDAYADSIDLSLSMWFKEGENILGPPDGKFTRLYAGYGNGHVTLDLGPGEEIRDGAGKDFRVSARGGKYAILLSNNLSSAIVVPNQGSSFILLGEGIGNTSFDLAVIDFEQARYIQIVYISGEDVEVDAIEAFYYNIPPHPSLNSVKWQFLLFGGMFGIFIMIVIWIQKRKKRG